MGEQTRSFFGGVQNFWEGAFSGAFFRTFYTPPLMGHKNDKFAAASCFPNINTVTGNTILGTSQEFSAATVAESIVVKLKYSDSEKNGSSAPRP